MARVFRLDRDGMGELLRSPQMAEAMKAIAEQVKTSAETLAPRDTGAYAASFETDTHVRADRVVAIVRNTDPAALSIELGTARSDGDSVQGVRTQPHYTLLAALSLGTGGTS